ncbi:UDP-N-acetylmuramoyl-tripeptide--D-alanyl-D-alanine ligase [Rugamonas sp. DEMB1]|uniref:UDP-N-acetylmuramoyl-tripeptide--D-alanyl-D- alanine ligase n=1 Tax=Rugamonas sp. DEMB1 TaxID=3039386 RepID=UPI002449DFC0|nr:UDP-N-acetylmuramoyl-tripeptide--D-alanyl-D-alanine ligase [Rugamonas sp. DEMB1]WGG49598.1 UDP-N-acetylmuramoyl-tripeptide--D-alanyl-D-alanine ligase [Rugamonas sp. DEMB1]
MHAVLAQLLPSIAGARLENCAAGSVTSITFTGVSTDSRSVAAGALFVALRGEVFDAHAFLAQVAERGVAAVVVEELPAGWTLPAIVVPDTLVALGQIANHWRRQFDLPLIGVTGSNGKTTVKEMIAGVLAAAYGEDGRLATRGNLNNEIGVPLTLFRLDAAQRAAVVELGMNHPGEIGRLAAIAAPTIGMVNNAQREHQEFMHTVEAVALENGAVLAALPADGVAVFPHGDEFTPLWQGLAGARRVLTFGLSKDAEVSCTFRAGDFGNQMFITIRQDGAEAAQFFVALQAAGEHNVRNALAAVACTFAAGIPLEAIKLGLDGFAPVSGRLQKKAAANGAVLIDDTYNANPDSVRAAIDVLAKAAAPRVLVLGDMGEVGDQGREFHQEIGAYAQSKGIEQVLTIGELARHMHGASIRHFEHIDALLAALDATVTSSATVLIKGSRFMKMERVVQHLIGSQQANKETH